jgi:selenocysteine lyase/cysteine desulfurase
MYSIRTLADRLVPKLPYIASPAQASISAPRHSRPWRLDAAFRLFQKTYPQYAATQALDRLRATEYARLDRQAHIYLDYTGGGLYAESQLRDHMALLSGQVFGNPHSKNLTSLAMTERVEQARRSVLRYFNADPDEYDMIFTPNATGALKLVGEAYPFAPGGNYALTFDNHNSVNGIREFARAAGATVTYIPIVAPELRADSQALAEALELARPGEHNLFAYPAQSNFSGVQHPLEWIEQAQARGWDVLLDAAAFAPSNRMDLGRWHPDFVDISFYKIFGYPTGIGCLLARKPALQKLRRPWYAGGTITFSSVIGDGHYLTPGPDGFEDGTVNYLSLPAVERGLEQIESVGIETIHTRVICLTGWLIEQLTTLRHSNGRPVVRLYGPAGTDMRGGTVQVNFFDPSGRMIDCNAVEQLANHERISLRAGCHCNPGAREVALGFTPADLAGCFSANDQRSFEQFLQLIDGKTTGALRASIGLASNFADVYAYVQFAKTFVDRPAEVTPRSANRQQLPHQPTAPIIEFRQPSQYADANDQPTSRRSTAEEEDMIRAGYATNRPLVWLRRYLPAELTCTITALLGAWLAAALTGSPAVAAVAGTWGENLGFYGMMLSRELAQRGPRSLPAIIRDLVLEFGVAEALDSLLLRPALMYAGMLLAPNTGFGVIAGKLAADLVFYVPTIISYELLRRRERIAIEELSV